MHHLGRVTQENVIHLSDRFSSENKDIRHNLKNNIDSSMTEKPIADIIVLNGHAENIDETNYATKGISSVTRFYEKTFIDKTSSDYDSEGINIVRKLSLWISF